MRPWLDLTVPDLLRSAPEGIAAALAAAQMARRLSGEPAQLRAWTTQVALLQAALAGPRWAEARIAFEYDMLRLEKRIDAVLVTPRAIFVLEFKVGATAFTPVDRAQAEDYAQDLWDFHANSRAHPILPVLVATEARRLPPLQFGLPTPGVAPVADCNGAALGERLAALQDALPAPVAPLDPAAWITAPYKPVPTIVEAAARLFARNSVADIAAARADTDNLTRTTEAILRALEAARAAEERVVVFVTGVPGAGKTLCGLNIVFGEHRRLGTAFLTGNAPLVAVLREALACDRAGIDLALGPSHDPLRRQRAGKLRQARHETAQALQNVHRFLADNAHAAAPPAERVIIFDEAQRAWDAAQAGRDTQRRKSVLTMSEPAHALAIMGRHAGFAAIVALIGHGQEINTGEAGLAEWGRVIAATPGWRAVAAPRALTAREAAQRLNAGPAPWLTLDDALDLTVPIRSVRSEAGAAWVDAMLRGDAAGARAIAEEAGGVPYFLTRSLGAARAALRGWTPGLRRAGFVRSSGARRLRAEGFDAQLIGTEEPVAWFLERWPDIRASDALEVAATEYACQGLELDAVGLAWGGDMMRAGAAWRCRRFAGRGWQQVNGAAEQEFIRNTYRVLLTRARYETVIWVPPGSAADDPFHDATRPAAEMDAIAAFLQACGARPLPAPVPPPRAEAATLL
ncbi:DNA/RNA helicase domain-containing protein [Sediminicoccus rosea]|uniref:DNA/RNA helicase domain-containing protein n=1 Tax=Sediminicoccus rosea TaxID=1225128 RepID=A0ABZ0PLX3_9PROT|nr:DNA/RNA helicase domain-containing protein [Sediminicoccus rosea]WPB86226.1 DNA/RNA helicase domain-containing protein [Sediminicoccus rosea]